MTTLGTWPQLAHLGGPVLNREAMRVALVHDWLVTYRGGEKVLEAICEMYPRAELYTLLHRPGSMPEAIENRPIHTSFLQRIPGIYDSYRHWLPLFPAAIQSFDLSGADLVISSSHCAAKGIRKPKGARHLSYLHAPMRYMWDRFEDYFGFGRASLPIRLAALALRPALQSWDRRTAKAVDRFVANSDYIANKIQRIYGRPAAVIPPPVELQRFAAAPEEGRGLSDYFLWVGAFAPYKRLDIALDAFRELPFPLWVAGSGQEEKRIRRTLPPNVRLLGQVSDEALVDLYRRARALIFTAEEDFGLAPVEAQAAGRPVIALAKGGALETVTPRTGVFFSRQTPEDLIAAVRRFEQWVKAFSPLDARSNAQRFTKASFQGGLQAQVEELMDFRAA